MRFVSCLGGTYLKMTQSRRLYAQHLLQSKNYKNARYAKRKCLAKLSEALFVGNHFKIWLFHYFTFCQWSSPKMQQIIKQACPSRQLFETVNFPFMKIFDFFYQNSPFGGLSTFLGWFVSQTTAENRAQWLNKCADHIAIELDFGRNLWHESPRKKQKGPKKGDFD